MSSELWNDLNKLLKKHNTTMAELQEIILRYYHTSIAELYWAEEIMNYVECCEDYKDVDLSKEQLRNITHDILDDDHIWQNVDESIDWYIHHNIIQK